MYTGISAADRTRGLADERSVKAWLATRYEIVEASRHEQIFEDIDCWVISQDKRTPISIKSSLASLQYKNIGLELVTGQENKVEWSDALLTDFYGIQEMRQKFPDASYLQANYRPAWFLFGKAEQYLFLMGNSLLKVGKLDLLSHCHKVGFDYTRWLTAECLEGQQGKNAMSGYIYWNSLNLHQVPHNKLMLG